MDPELLRAFLAVADSGGFSAAARQVHRTQSAVSLQIRRLEDRVGARLFERTSRNVALTASGERLLPYARQILGLQDEALRAMVAGRAEPVRLGLSEEQAGAYLPGLLAELAERAPDLRLEVVCDISREIVARFAAGQLDAALAVRHGPTRTGRLLGHERMVWAAAPDFDVARDPLPLALNPEGCIFRAHALAALGRVGRRWRDSHVSTAPTAINLAVQAGMAATVKTPRSLPPGCRQVTRGLPELGHVEIELHLSPARISDTFRVFSEALERAVLQSPTLSPVPARSRPRAGPQN